MIVRCSGSAAIVFAMGFVGACGGKPGTHIEVVDKNGEHVYVAGAAAPGINRGIACTGAVKRSVAALSDKWADDNDSIAEEVAKNVGASDGKVFLARYAADEVLRAAVQDVQFDPGAHLCMATISWTPPVFVKEAIQKYADAMKRQELGAPAASPVPAAKPTPMTAVAPPQSAVAPPPAPVASPVPAPVVVPASTVPPPAAAVAPSAAPAAPKAPACTSDKKKLSSQIKTTSTAVKDFDECMRRVGDVNTCHRYKLYVDEGKQKEKAAGEALVACLNGGLATAIRLSITHALPGHAGLVVENRADGSLIVWAWSPVGQTGFVLEVGADGAEHSREALAANQLQWLKSNLGL